MSAATVPRTTSREGIAALDDFAPVTLDALVSTASLLTRVDRKYVLPFEAATTILGEATDGARVLEIDARRSFGYGSVYFDTHDHLAYRLTAQRRRRRFKLRTRTYGGSGACFLEVKTKDGRGRTVKERIGYPAADHRTLTQDGQSFAREVLRRHGHEATLVEWLGPVLTTRYHRSTLLLRCGSRATVDTDLRWHDDQGREAALPDHVIVETKSTDRASALDRSLWRAGYRPRAISKFGTGMAALHPELPRNAWARVLNGPVTASLT